MNDGIEAFRSQLQKELGLSIRPKDPLLALWVSQRELLEQNAVQWQKLLSEFQAALAKSQTAWSEQAKALAQQSLNAGLQAAQNRTALLLEEAARMNGAAVRKASEEGVARMEQALAVGRLIAWRWPLPQRTPQNPTMISAADVVSSKLWVESLFAKIQEANEKPNKSHCQKSVGISEKPSQATDQACERKCSRPNFATVFAFQPDKGAGT